MGRTVVVDKLMVMAGVRTGQVLERIARLVGVTNRADRLALSARAARHAPDPTLEVHLADGLLAITGIGDDTDAAALWLAAVEAADRLTVDLAGRYAGLFGPATGVVVGGGWLNDPTIEAAVGRRFPSARRSRFGEPGAVGAACLAGISAGVIDGPFGDARTTGGNDG